MSGAPNKASVEFLQFIADISDPATGEIMAKELAVHLSLSEPQLYEAWIARDKYVPWSVFVDELLAVLDVVQDLTQDFSKTVHWFSDGHVPIFDMKSPQDIVAAGQARALVRLIKQGIVAPT